MDELPAPMPVLTDSEWIVFGGEPSRIPGVVEDHAFDAVRALFARKVEDVQKDWEKVAGQVQRILSVFPSVGEGFQLSGVKLSLGFSAEGQLVFIAKAGIQATVEMSFERKGP